MNNTHELLKEIIGAFGYQMVENDGESLSVSFQLNTIYLHSHSQDESFVIAILSNYPIVTKDNYNEILAKCNKMNKKLQQVKFYIMNDRVISSVEFHYWKKSDLRFQLKKAMENLVVGKVEFFN